MRNDALLFKWFDLVDLPHAKGIVLSMFITNPRFTQTAIMTYIS